MLVSATFKYDAPSLKCQQQEGCDGGNLPCKNPSHLSPKDLVPNKLKNKSGELANQENRGKMP